MLKALELVGFKSFADKTRFEFPDGITVVVGPNGSGKSNVVDGIKWVLGEQSAKSLRGKEMADVIFKGSGGATGRKAMNTAEATIVIDNAQGNLPYDAPEVHITRRVYRSGEGEYLINGQACRLKDIRDLFRGSGVGTDAYSLIEQGKVDQMLQSTPKDRRAMFEEAAGISRFKAKKVEAQRRLERVDQNLVRLSDIVDEVDSRLRSVRAQAGKARRYKEYSERLQQLRTFVGMTDWHKLTEKLDNLDEQIRKLGDETRGLTARCEAIEARSLELEVEVVDVENTLRESEARTARTRERIAALEFSMEHERSRSHDLDEEESRHRQHLMAMGNRSDDLQQRLWETSQRLEIAGAEFEKVSAELASREKSVAELTERIDTLRTENEASRNRHIDQMRRASTLSNDVSALESESSVARATAERCSEQLDLLKTECAGLSEKLTSIRQKEQQLTVETEEKAEALDDNQRRVEEIRRAIAEQREELSRLQLQHSGVNERVSVLSEMERRLDGIGAGVRQVLSQAKEPSPGAFADACGLVADLIKADTQYAKLIDVALGDSSQHVVLVGTKLWNQMCEGEVEIPGRVGFVRVQSMGAEDPAYEVDLAGKPGIVGRLDQLVRTNAKCEDLVRRLLGRTWVVKELAEALNLLSLSAGVRFVTIAGELVESNGTLVVGAAEESVGLVSRRSELSTLQATVTDLEQQIQIVTQEIDRRQAELYQCEQAQNRLAAEHKEAYAALTEARVQTEAAQQRLEQAEKQGESVCNELETAETQIAETRERLESSQTELKSIQDEVVGLEQSMERDSETILQLESQCQLHAQQATAAKVSSAKSEQQVANLTTQMSQFEEDQRERDRSISETRSQLTHCLSRRRHCDATILKATSEVAELYLLKESIAREAWQHARGRDQLASERSSLSSEVRNNRKKLRGAESKQHQLELSAGELRHERGALAERLLEDYGIDIAKVEYGENEEEQQKREEIENEIADLRRKINNIGAVNVDALNELDELETRCGSLSGQYNDLKEAKESLERIITKINSDSRRLFSETLEAIRTNFQAIYRKAFGGGRADLVLEEGVDILEGGIDIIATPPGKPEFNNSLLSGGERALTAVSLIMAIFQYRPSPFCVLDEVDAPFDEANIGRFIDVLKEFLGWTKFVIVTHSKKTMTSATTLYGVTMQESGVSKQVSVKFEDVSEDGHISATAIERQESDDADAA